MIIIKEETTEIIWIGVETTIIEINIIKMDIIKGIKVEIISNFKIINNNLTQIKISKKIKLNVFFNIYF